MSLSSDPHQQTHKPDIIVALPSTADNVPSPVTPVAPPHKAQNKGVLLRKAAIEVQAQRAESPEIQLPDSPGSWTSLADLLEVSTEKAKPKLSPIERFRPKRPVTATDLVSSSYCEVQHLYDLTENDGSLFRTTKMKDGSKHHLELETEIFDYQEVTTVTRADWFAVKLWNARQALHVFNTDGKTREVTVFGILSGQVVTGIIDELVDLSPNPNFESIAKKGTNLQETDEREKNVYIYETKTRSAPGIPHHSTVMSAFMQLRIYHKLLHDMAFGPDISRKVMARYGVKPGEALSKETQATILPLIGQDNLPPQTKVKESGDIRLNSLILWKLMMKEIKTLLPRPDTLSPMLTVAYEQVQTRDLIGTRHIMRNEELLSEFVEDKMKLWTGARAARGVDIEEAYKCQRCRFAENCEWRIERLNGSGKQSKTTE